MLHCVIVVILLFPLSKIYNRLYKIIIANCIHSSERKKGWYVRAMGDEGSQPVSMAHVAETFFPVAFLLSDL